MSKESHLESALRALNTYSAPSQLRITDMRVTSLVGVPFKSTVIKIMTNQGITGFGEVRDFASRNYALMLKRLILGENPLNVERIFKKIRQFGGPSRQGGGVSGVEIALWDIVGKAYSVPIYQFLGGKYRDTIRVYCDTHIDAGLPNTGKNMGLALKEKMEEGFTFLKMNLKIDLLYGTPGALSWPEGMIESFAYTKEQFETAVSPEEKRYWRARKDEIDSIPWMNTGIRITEKGLDLLEQYVAEIRAEIGYEIPLAVDHIGHVSEESMTKLARRLEKYNLAWIEDPFPWQMTRQYVRLSHSAAVPLATGEDIYTCDAFLPLFKAGGISVAHTDVLTCGGIAENKRIGDTAQNYGITLATHMAETPVACMAAVHSIAATENATVMEFHASDIPWWNDLIKSKLPKPLIEHGFIRVPDLPGLGIDDLNDEVLKEHLDPEFPVLWGSTEEWDNWYSRDRLWS